LSRESGPSSVSLLICESVLNERSGGVSAIRIMDVLHIGLASPVARFFVLTYLHSRTVDFTQHFAKVHMLGMRNGQWSIVAEAPTHFFVYSYGPPESPISGPGAFMLTTEFNLDLTTFGELGTFWVQLSVDGVLEEQTPITLLRKR
jgi:hypothetical protein